MRISIAISLVFGSVFFACAADQEKLFSGPQKGEKITPFKVLVVNSPEDVKEVTIVDADKKGTTLLIFLHKLTEPAIGMMISVEWYASKQKGLTSHFVLLTDDKPKTEQMAKRWAQRPFFAASPMCISVDGPEGPGRYGLNRKVDMTVLIAKDYVVVDNLALVGPNNTNAPQVLEKLANSLGKPAPSFDKIRAELLAKRTRQREMRMKANPIYKLAPNAELARLMTRMVRREGNNSAYTKRIPDEMMKWIGENEERRAALAKYCRTVLDGKFELREHQREQLKSLALEK